MENAPVDRDAAIRVWREYAETRPELADVAEPGAVEQFGDNSDLTDELIELVLHGPKRATAALVAEFAAEGEPLPRIGDHWVACDSTGRPRAILRSTELRIGPFSSVDAAFAYDEGEDDRTLDSWRDGHRRYWSRAAERLGFTWSEDLEVVFERFEVVWRTP
ncbi:ASCH domain-containing protein [Homoserinibacter sp. GY 40078]|uniref:ASCH domain-containing protein n=1 Tax=Homoserinibacter sp. GY 40078 TaxID=2603275 RepID=UPI0021023090|nr:ASCH domain-containing protein [Homoserinibacter sp. GY 40078]